MSPHERNLVVKYAVLAELVAGPLQGRVLKARLESTSKLLERQCEDFDFVHWANGTLWDLLTLFDQLSFIEASGPRRLLDDDWNDTSASLTVRGRDYLHTIVQEFPLAASLCTEVAARVAVG